MGSGGAGGSGGHGCGGQDGGSDGERARLLLNMYYLIIRKGLQEAPPPFIKAQHGSATPCNFVVVVLRSSRRATTTAYEMIGKTITCSCLVE